ncbi:MAG: hypothetical protein AAF658_11600 [Myxococcota bacterium]
MVAWSVVVVGLMTAQVDTPRSGAICELSGPLTVVHKIGGKAKRSRLKKADRLVLVNLSKGWSKIRIGDNDRYARSKVLKKRCTWSSPETPDVYDEGEVAMASAAWPIRRR